MLQGKITNNIFYSKLQSENTFIVFIIVPINLKPPHHIIKCNFLNQVTNIIEIIYIFIKN